MSGTFESTLVHIFLHPIFLLNILEGSILLPAVPEIPHQL